MASETNTMGNEKCNVLTAYSSKENEKKQADLQDVLPGYFADIMRRTGNNYIELRKALFNMDIIPTQQEPGAAEIHLVSCQETDEIRENRRREIESFEHLKSILRQ